MIAMGTEIETQERDIESMKRNKIKIIVIKMKYSIDDFFHKFEMEHGKI